MYLRTLAGGFDSELPTKESPGGKWLNLKRMYYVMTSMISTGSLWRSGN